MKAQIGDKVVKLGGFGDKVLIVEVLSRTDNTIRAGYPAPATTTIDKKAHLSTYRHYDELKVERMVDLQGDIQDKMTELRELFNSLPKLE